MADLADLKGGSAARSAPIDLAREADLHLGSALVRPSLSEVVAASQTIRLQPRVMQVQLAGGLTRKAEKIEELGDEGHEAVCLAFTRLARAVRQINFQEQEILGLRETARREEREAHQKAEQEAGKRQKALEKRVVRDAVLDLVNADRSKDYLDVNKFNSRFERDYDDYYDLYRGSFEEIIRRICRDMGIDGVEPPPEDSAELASHAPLDTPIGKRLHIAAAVERLHSLQGTGPP